MRIESIKLKNYRQYVNAKIDFPDIYDSDIHIVIGSNGTGKTTLFNAINWCLYGEEPHIFSEENGLPIINTKILEETDDREVSVEIKVNVSNEESYLYTRRMIFDNVINNSQFEIYIIKNGESQQLAPKYNEMYVNKFVNKLIKEFYFFDGEKLDDYFKKDNMGKIKNNVLEVSNIEKLIKMETHLNTKRSEFLKKSKNKGSNIESIANEIEIYEKRINSDNEKIEETENRLNNLQNDKMDIDNELQGIPDVNKIKIKIDKLNNQLEKKNEVIDSNKKKRDDLNFNYAPRIFLFEAIKAITEEIKNREDNNQLPSPIDESAIKKSISKCQCELCKNQLNDDKLAYLEKVLQDYDLSDEDSKLLRSLESPLNSNLNKIKSYESKSKNILIDGKRLSSEYDDIMENMNEYENEILGYDDDEISKKYKLKTELESDIQDDMIEIGSLKQKKHTDTQYLNQLKRQLNVALEKDEKTKIIQKKLELCNDSLDVVQKTKDEIMKKTKENIEDYTNEKFKELLWKQDTYDHISIDDKYNLQLFHSSGRQGLGSASAAERELLALAYTLGIHSVSGYNSPLIIDTPLSRVSDEHKKNFSESLIKISENKQIILLFTPDEFSSNIQGFFKDFPQYEIKLSEDEKTSDIRSISGVNNGY